MKARKLNYEIEFKNIKKALKCADKLANELNMPFCVTAFNAGYGVFSLEVAKGQNLTILETCKPTTVDVCKRFVKRLNQACEHCDCGVVV
ncbi:hypothetical protein THIOSC15_590006 [uncultured Thiomicrorhabdus sp.]